MTHEQQELLIQVLGLAVVIAPAVMVICVGLPTLLGRPLAEQTTARILQSAIAAGLAASLAILALMVSLGTRHVPVELGNWVVITDYHFSIKFVFDRLSVPFVIFSFILCGVIGAFANRYMHRERGYNRFFVFYAVFVLGMVVTALAGTIETLFAGWELVGLSSALLVAFYHDRPAPVRNGLRVWAVYRISDAALLIAAVVMHHLTGEGDFDKLTGLTSGGFWPEGSAQLDAPHALAVGLLLLDAAAAKSALVPFSGWLPRAMEGPTPSSAVFYGALSVHLGAFLLLRVSPILDVSLALSASVVCVGLVTAIFAAFAARVQTDIKSALSFASLTQVGIIVTEIGLGLRYIALIHIISHGFLRTLQFVRAPTLLLDYRNMENAIGSSLPRLSGSWERLIPARFRAWFYRLALERGYLDAWLADWIVHPFIRAFQRCDAMERRWTTFLAGRRSEGSDRFGPNTEPGDDLA
jgi:NADH-quinone oxidoreductase subunit L